ncbi:cytochrome P450 18a1-like [Parasteatoda tepidariorum]|uniref:cytochrome P450 18a1-like n=1 Tax=Parasteatoda tepidariorum TaxID=114398 RepID=UPI0039BD40A5
MMELTTALLFTCLIAFIIYLIAGRDVRKLPPGPYGLPFVGYIPFMSSSPYLDLQKLAKKYGSVFRLRLGTQNTIVLSDYQATKAAFFQDAFMGRPPANPFDLSKETLETGAFNELPWKEQRRFSLHMLRDLGFAKTRMEEHLKEEIHDLLEHLEEFGGKPIVLKPHLAPSMSNNIATLVFGERLNYDHPVRRMLDKGLSESAAAAGQVAWELFFPFLASVVKLFGFSGAAKIAKTQKETRDYIMKQIDQHEQTLDENNIRDYIDGYLLEIRKRNDKAFCKPVLQDMVGAFFGAGSETVRLTLDWLTLTMASFPHVQEKVVAEIETVIGRNRTPCWKDHTDMPYTEATIMELMRWRTIIPINVLRYTLADTELNGYFIPKECYVVANLWDIHHNPEYWGRDAEEFRVERFLTDDGKQVKKSEYFIPFSIGKRQCPGESFAKIEVFLYFVSILQKFKISLSPGTKPDFDGVLGIGLCPKPHELCLTKRN